MRFLSSTKSYCRCVKESFNMHSWAWEDSGCDLTIRKEDFHPQGREDQNHQRQPNEKLKSITYWLLPCIILYGKWSNSKSCESKYTLCSKAIVFKLLYGQCHSVFVFFSLFPLFNLALLWIIHKKERTDLKVTTFEIKAFRLSPLSLIYVSPLTILNTIIYFELFHLLQYESSL